tara:strand:- start:429 stop:605 length:177 start_codon:yes stop_codon:yes gene_type:complete
MNRDYAGFLTQNITGFRRFGGNEYGFSSSGFQSNGFTEGAPTSQPIAASFSNACGCAG